MARHAQRRVRVIQIYDAVAAEYDQIGPAFYAMNGAALVTRLGLRPGERVLDAGCGRGACLIPAAAAVGPAGHVIGIDVSPAMVEQAAAEAARHGLTVTVTTGDAQDPDFPPGSFDVVLSGFVLRLLPDPAVALRAYSRVLRDGGRFGATIYASTFGGPWQPVESVLEHFMQPVPPQDDALDPAEKLAALLSESGFADVTVEDEPFDIWLADPDEWWRYLWASGYRGMMERIPDRDREAARAAATTAAARIREPDGRLRLFQQVRYATATRR